MGIAALSVLEGDGKRNAAFLLKIVFFLGWLGVFSTVAAKYIVRLGMCLGICQVVLAIVVLSVYYNCGRWKVK